MKIGVTPEHGVVVVDSGEARALTGPPGRGLVELLQPGCDIRQLVGPSSGLWDESVAQAPLRPGKIIAIGLNYRDHTAETGTEAPAAPLIFAKFPSSVIGPREPIVIDSTLTSQADWEAELGVVIGRRMRNVAAGQALEYVFGYTVANDVSARDAQLDDGQWARGKSFDTFCPLGPVVITADEIPDPQQLQISTRLNNELVQQASTSSMIFSVAELLAYCSRNFTLEPGDLVLTGTPSGVGIARSPQLWLRPGDILHTHIDGIGTLRNPVSDPRGGDKA